MWPVTPRLRTRHERPRPSRSKGQLTQHGLVELYEIGSGSHLCAALAARGDPAEELEFAVSLVNRVVEDASTVRTGVHICRGNWSRNEGTLLRGSYAALAPYLNRLRVTQLVLECATERAGEVLPFDQKEIGLGVVNPRTDILESGDEIRASICRALQHYSSDRIFLNPDCGFGTFSNRPMNSEAVAVEKLRAMTAAARALRG